MTAEAERRRTQGVAGEWEVVEQQMSNKDNGEAETTPESSKKREAEGHPDSEDTRSFKLRKKVAPSVMDDLDTELIPIKLKPKTTEGVQEPTEGTKREEESSQPTGTATIKWTSRGWKRPEDEPDGTPSSATLKDEEVEKKPVAIPEPVAAVLESQVKEEPKASSVKMETPETVAENGAVFRKRKFGGNRGKR